MTSVNTAPNPALAKAKDHPAQVKETLISLVIAFVMAFVFRAFVAEAFIIPTGSMAPTLLGENIRTQSPSTGVNWPVNPPPMGGSGAGLRVHDPMTGEEVPISAPRRAGDRILVFKYLYQIYNPSRWDVVVFKAPHDPQTNYIKRLTGLPGEQLALIDGDVFVRRPPAGEQHSGAGVNLWTLSGWGIQRKPERVQRTVWQDVFWSQYDPLIPVRLPRGGNFRAPWLGDAAWEIAGRRSYTYTGAGPTRLSWDEKVPIVDSYAYNDLLKHHSPPPNTPAEFPVSDINLSAGIEPAGAELEVAAVVQARGHEFRAEIRGTTATLRMGALGQGQTVWTTLATATLPHAIESGRVTNVEFWHVDQALQLWIDGALVANEPYSWSPPERVRASAGITVEEVFNAQVRAGRENPLADPSRYRQPRVWWEFSGPVTLHRVGLQRDLYYQPAAAHTARAVSPLNTFTLGADHFFVCGDNSPASLDARLWGPPDAWVAKEIDPAPGVVPRDLLIGRAFFVYFPALTKGGLGIPVPDFGRLRWIW